MATRAQYRNFTACEKQPGRLLRFGAAVVQASAVAPRARRCNSRQPVGSGYYAIAAQALRVPEVSQRFSFGLLGSHLLSPAEFLLGRSRPVSLFLAAPAPARFRCSRALSSESTRSPIPTRLAHGRRLTLRSNGPSTAGGLGPAAGTPYIFVVRAKPAYRGGPFSSNVRPHRKNRFPGTGRRCRAFHSLCVQSERCASPLIHPRTSGICARGGCRLSRHATLPSSQRCSSTERQTPRRPGHAATAIDCVAYLYCARVSKIPVERQGRSAPGV